MLSHRPFFQGNSCNCKMNSQLCFLPSSHNIHSMCRSKNRAARSLCGSHLHFCNLRHVFQRTGVFFWPSDLGDNSHGWKLLMASWNQHCKQIFVVVFRLFFSSWICVVVLWPAVVIAVIAYQLGAIKCSLRFWILSNLYPLEFVSGLLGFCHILKWELAFLG